MSGNRCDRRGFLSRTIAAGLFFPLFKKTPAKGGLIPNSNDKIPIWLTYPGESYITTYAKTSNKPVIGLTIKDMVNYDLTKPTKFLIRS